MPQQNDPRRVVVIGYGSPIRGDDALGPLVADRLIDEFDSQQVQVFSRHILTAELVEPVSSATLVLFLDAAADGPPGQVLCQPLEPDDRQVSTLAHFLDPRELLAWSRALYQYGPPAYLISVRGEEFGYASYQLSPTVAASVDTMLACVRQLIRSHLA
jgi:hydrogenase maturation protease